MKRGSSGLSLLVAVNKPLSLSSHDVVNRARRIFGERRVGHTGTLDPLATGVLPICVGPATRLDRFMTGHDKRYRVAVAFGTETTTDDAEGEVVRAGQIPDHLRDESYAESFLKSLIGPHKQLPPAYSAIKVNGQKAYEAARKGREVQLEYRDIVVRDAVLLGLAQSDDQVHLLWDVEFEVSKGTYIRSLARDIGRIVGCPAHVQALQRTRAGRVGIESSVSLETLEALGTQAALDPVAALGLRYAFADDVRKYVEAGNRLYEDQLRLNEPLRLERDACACMGSTCPSNDAPQAQELVSVVVGNRLKAIYSFDERKHAWKPDCIFQVPIFRG